MKKYFFISLINVLVTYSQEIPNQMIEYKLQDIAFNKGLGWEKLTHFSPMRYQNINFEKNNNIIYNNNDSVVFNSKIGLFTKNNGFLAYATIISSFKKYFYTYFYPRLSNENNLIANFSGKELNKSRIGIKYSDINFSGIGFQNEWSILQLGRGREAWGAGDDIQLVLNKNTKSYDYFKLGLFFKNLRFKYMHGFLESDSQAINRYISAHGIEWYNDKNLIISLSEIVIYSGQNRPIDFSYLNPFNSHLEIEFNDRQNSLGFNSGNAVWQLSFDWMINKTLRISTNLLVDELVIDASQRDQEKSHGLAASSKMTYNTNLNKNNLFLYVMFGAVGKNTFRHSIGSNNFVQRSDPLGPKYGSDAMELKVGSTLYSMDSYIIDIYLRSQEIGENSIINDPYKPYENYKTGKFPSGVTQKNTYLNINFEQWNKKDRNRRFYFNVQNKINTNSKIDTEFNVGFDFYRNLISKGSY